MKVWRPGITGKLFLAIFATCIVLLISMHWAVRAVLNADLLTISNTATSSGYKCWAMRWATSTSNTATGVFTQQRSLRFPDSAFI